MYGMRQKSLFNKITIFIVGSSLMTAVIIFRLFQLQVISHAYYQDQASRAQSGSIALPAQRGDIIIKDYHSGEEFAAATNTTLNLLYVDPTLIKDPLYVRDKIAPLIFNLQDEQAADAERIKTTSKNIPADATEEAKNKLLKPLSDTELEAKFNQNLLSKISEKQRREITLATDLKKDAIDQINKLNLPGITVKNNNVYAYPKDIKNTTTTATKIAPLVEIPDKKLEILLRGENRYLMLKRKLSPEISEKITAMIKADKNKSLTGIGMKEEYFRFYPEGSLASSVLGYVNQENVGQYGIESTFNNQLQGINGKLQTKKDSIGRQITVGESTLQAAVDGDNIVLTIDRSIQLTVEKYLAEDAKKFGAISGQAVIMDPKTGAIIAMANYPSFDPNNYGDVFNKVEINLTSDEIKKLEPTKNDGIYYMYFDDVTQDRYLVFEKKDENGNTRYYRYANYQGPEVYHNKIVSWPYEPGSVFKAIAMSIAIDDGDVTPNTTFNDNGPVPVDYNVYTKKYDYEIKNSTNKYWGLIDMQTVIAKSLNTGMTFVAKKIGAPLFYSYLKKFGFLDRTDIEFDNEVIGKIEDPVNNRWTESELATHAFGQGISVTMIQLVNAYAAIANGGTLMQPHIIAEIRHPDGTVSKTEPRQIRRVISEDTTGKMTKILIYTIENGEGHKGTVEGHYIAGKTGTSQTYGTSGRALFGKGTTIGTFAGFAPVVDPKFVVLIKYDHPKENEWGSSTAAETFSKIGAYLFDYYNIPPDKPL